MSRQADVKAEERQVERHNLLIRVLEFDLAGVLEVRGGELRGLAITYEAFSCRLVLKAAFNDKQFVSFHYSETMIGCLLAAFNGVNRNSVTWLADKYQSNEV